MIPIMKYIVIFCSINGHGNIDQKCLRKLLDCVNNDINITQCQKEYILASNYEIGKCPNPELLKLYKEVK